MKKEVEWMRDAPYFILRLFLTLLGILGYWSWRDNTEDFVPLIITAICMAALFLGGK